MIAYVDSSVLLRIALGQPNSLIEWPSVRVGFSSALLEVECLRTLDRLRLIRSVDDSELATRREAVLRLVRSLRRIEITPDILQRAAQPLPTVLGTLDAIHLVTALRCQSRADGDLVMATHDKALGTAARAFGFLVIGI